MRKTRSRWFWLLWLTPLLLIALALTLFLANKSTPIDTNNPVGLLTLHITDEERNRVLDPNVWYPTADVGPINLHQENAVLQGFSAISNAALIKENLHPLVILSHGSGGNPANQSWLAAELARQGAIVVALQHPGSMSRDSAPETNILAWNRPRDVSFIIDALAEHPALESTIDMNRIAVIGHSLGGYTALALAGAELSLDAFIKYCEDFSENPDCTFYRDGGVDLAAVDRLEFEQDHTNPMVKAVVAIDPAYALSFYHNSIRTLINNTMVLAPTEDSRTYGSMQTASLAEQLPPGAQYHELDGAHHFSFLPDCRPLGKLLLRIVEPEATAICATEARLTRSEHHAETIRLVSNFLRDVEILD